jgi:Trehalose utilisation
MNRLDRPQILLALFASVCLLAPQARAEDPWVVLKGGDGPGHGKHVVLISGDEEYRSEEALPQLGKILAKHHGFNCTVLFAVAPDGTIDPNRQDNIPGLEALRKADLMIIATRFRNLPDDQMKEIADYVDSGRPIIGMRTATHAFNLKASKKYSRYSWTSKEWDGGFGRQVLGETWISHHGHHNVEGTRGLIAPGAESHPILRGIKDGDIWGTTDVYGVRLPLPGDSKPLILGQVIDDMTATGKPVLGKKNDPMMPVAWVKTFTSESGKAARIFTTTMGAASDMPSAGTRRLLVNATYWAVGLEDKIPAENDVSIVGEFKPHHFGNDKFTKGVKPSDLIGQ